MAHFAIRSHLSQAVAILLTGSGVLAAASGSPVHADAVAYLLNVTVRPGYNFPNSDAALAYGNGVCAKIAAGSSYGQIMSDVKADLANPDEYQASYLISQATNELCPALIWQLRKSAAHYRLPQ